MGLECHEEADELHHADNYRNRIDDRIQLELSFLVSWKF